MSRHARPSSGRGGGWFFALAFAVLVVGAYLANAVDSTTQRPAIGLAALAGAALALVSARAERQTRARMEDLTEARRRDVWRMRSELDEAHARSSRALNRAVAAEAAVQTLMAVTESLLAVRHTLLSASAVPASVVAAAPADVAAAVSPTELPAPTGPPVLPAEPAPAAVPAQPMAPAATLVWPLADLPAPQREPARDLPLVPAPGVRNSQAFVPSGFVRAVPATVETTSGIEPAPASELVDLTWTTTRYARPA